MILGKDRILALVRDAKLIEGFAESSLGGAGYDLRVGRFHRPASETHLGVSDRKMPKITELSGDRITLKPGEYVLVETIEKVNMPANVAAKILPRSSLFRLGCSLETALVDPGYKGALTMGLSNISKHDFTIERGARIAQIVFEEVEGETTLYKGKYQGGKVV
jgi:dCTP deaminase/dUTP pyrophosphatase